MSAFCAVTLGDVTLKLAAILGVSWREALAEIEDKAGMSLKERESVAKRLLWLEGFVPNEDTRPRTPGRSFFSN